MGLNFSIGTGIVINLELNFSMGTGIGIQKSELTPAREQGSGGRSVWERTRTRHLLIWPYVDAVPKLLVLVYAAIFNMLIYLIISG